MASPKSKSRPRPQKPSGRPQQRPSTANASPTEVVDPIWLAKAIVITILAAFLCGYLTLCLLFYQGQWQLVLHPSRSAPTPADIVGVPFRTIHFGVDESASPQLTGWLIPAEPSARYAAYTVLYLPSGDGSLADAASRLSALHETGINVFAFDYRGYGQSATSRPNEQRMTEDAASAWQYLTVSHHVPASHIVLFGAGVGCALATHLATLHPEAPAIILESPRPDLIQTVLADPRVKSLPVHLLFHEGFQLAAPLQRLKTPKLFLLSPGSADPAATPDEVQRLTTGAASPKVVANFSAQDVNGPIYREQIVRFLDQYLH